LALAAAARRGEQDRTLLRSLIVELDEQVMREHREPTQVDTLAIPLRRLKQAAIGRKQIGVATMKPSGLKTGK